MVIPSRQYKDYEKACEPYIPTLDAPIDYPVNVECKYYMPTKRRVDLQNLLAATMDMLVKHKVLADDNRNIVYANDGSRVFYDKQFPRTEIVITAINEEEFERWGKE
jgi:Holliday junction resolvase RusA-like endonuclease